MDYVQELLADLARKIAQEEMDVRERVNRITHMAHPYDVKDQIREEWNRFHLRIKPMQDQQQYVLKQLAHIEACKTPGPIVIPAGHLLCP